MNEAHISECCDFLSMYSVNPFKISEWKRTLEGENFDPDEYDSLLLYFAANLSTDNLSFSYQNNVPKFLSELKNAVYDRLVDQRFRGKIDIFAQFGSAFVASTITNATPDKSAILTAFITLILLEVSKMGLDAWCSYYEKSRTRTK